MGIYDELSKLDTTSLSLKVPKQFTKEEVDKKDRPIDQSTKQSAEQSIEPSTELLTERPIDVDELGPVVDRPRAFYITQKVDRWLDEGVRYLKEKGMHKMDRSVLLNTLMHDPGLFKPKFLDEIRKKILAHLTNRSLKRVQ